MANINNIKRKDNVESLDLTQTKKYEVIAGYQVYKSTFQLETYFIEIDSDNYICFELMNNGLNDAEHVSQYVKSIAKKQ